MNRVYFGLHVSASGPDCRQYLSSGGALRLTEPPILRCHLDRPGRWSRLLIDLGLLRTPGHLILVHLQGRMGTSLQIYHIDLHCALLHSPPVPLPLLPYVKVIFAPWSRGHCFQSYLFMEVAPLLNQRPTGDVLSPG